jgi:hypothetical protein
MLPFGSNNERPARQSTIGEFSSPLNEKRSTGSVPGASFPIPKGITYIADLSVILESYLPESEYE